MAMRTDIKNFGLLVAVVVVQMTEEPSARANALNLAPARSGQSPVKSTVSATVADADDAAPVDTSEVVLSGKYLIASFPNLKQVAYCMLPDNVWRPLVLGDVTAPKGLAIDDTSHHLYVADPPESKIYRYKLSKNSDGLLMTDGLQHTVLEGFTVNWMAINAIGDLYFTGKATVVAPASSYDAVYRIDGALMAVGNKISPKEIYSRSNSGAPYPKVWMPSGIAVDSFYIYWGNQERGSQHGSVIKGSRMNVGGRSAPSALPSMNSAHDAVTGMMSTGTSLFYLTTEGVYGVPKTQGVPVADPNEGLIAGPPIKDANDLSQWDPKSIAWDGESTAYLTDFTAGKVYSIPTTSLKKHDLTKFVDAPGVHGMAVFSFEDPRSGSTRARGCGLLSLLLALGSILVRSA